MEKGIKGCDEQRAKQGINTLHKDHAFKTLVLVCVAYPHCAECVLPSVSARVAAKISKLIVQGPFSPASRLWFGARLGRTDRLTNVTFLRRKASVPLRREFQTTTTAGAAMAALG